jgi:hypothetical protein
MLKKCRIVSILISIPISFLSVCAFAGGGNTSLEELRANCERLKSNQQIKPFNIKVQCSGKYSYWERAENKTCMQNTAYVRTQTSSKGGMFQTAESIVAKDLDRSHVNCPVYSKMEVASPAGVGVVVSIDSCDELDAANLENMCEAKISSYCEDNQGGGAQQQSAQIGGMCSLTEVQRVDTCTSYN